MDISTIEKSVYESAREPAISWRVSPDLLTPFQPPAHPQPSAHHIWEIIPDHDQDQTAAMQVGFSSVAFLLSESV